jgi:enoyl-CoA hydratase/carnithine racemase
MSSFDQYGERFNAIHMRREDGILELRLHTDGGPARWGAALDEQLPLACREIARDAGNFIVILTGTGEEFTGPRSSAGDVAYPANSWDQIVTDCVDVMDSLLAIGCPVIAAVNGPTWRHAEVALLSDIVLASETATFQDSGHVPADMTPGDGINVMMPLIMGLTRARYFHLTGQELDARKALEFGLVNEVLAPAALLPRAWTLARQLLKRRPMVLRHTRRIFTCELRKRMMELLPLGLALEGLEAADAEAIRLSREKSGRGG